MAVDNKIVLQKVKLAKEEATTKLHVSNKQTTIMITANHRFLLDNIESDFFPFSRKPLFMQWYDQRCLKLQSSELKENDNKQSIFSFSLQLSNDLYDGF